MTLMHEPDRSIPRRTAGALRVRGDAMITRRLILPAQRFIFTVGATGRVLMVAAVVALVVANSPWAGRWEALWSHHVAIDLGFLAVDHSLRHWINDGLMTIFFFLVTLEVKREVLHGELSSRARAMLPLAAALGGMVVPAGIYLAMNAGSEAARGWGVPMATDIAFAIAAIQILGRGARPALVTFLLALAVVDDIGAILVIALFYTAELHVGALLVAVALAGVVIAVQRGGLHAIPAYWGIGILLWFAVLQSGVHATLAGVLLAALTPAHARYRAEDLAGALRPLVDRVEAAAAAHREDEAQATLGEIEAIVEQTESPLERLERLVHPWSGYLVLPVFALANASVRLDPGALGAAAGSPVAVGTALGLFLGKPVGILLFAVLAVRLGLAALPEGVGWLEVLAAGAIAGIGFSVSLFITELAFTDPVAAEQAKTGILAATALALVTGGVLLRIARARAAEA